MYTNSEIYDAAYRRYDVEDAIALVGDIDDRQYLAGGEHWAVGGTTFSAMFALYADRTGTKGFSADGLALMQLIQPLFRSATQSVQHLFHRRSELAN